MGNDSLPRRLQGWGTAFEAPPPTLPCGRKVCGEVRRSRRLAASGTLKACGPGRVSGSPSGPGHLHVVPVCSSDIFRSQSTSRHCSSAHHRNTRSSSRGGGRCRPRRIVPPALLAGCVGRRLCVFVHETATALGRVCGLSWRVGYWQFAYCGRIPVGSSGWTEEPAVPISASAGA